MKEYLTNIYVKHNSRGKTYDEFARDMERDFFMSAQEALDYGLVDKIIDRRA
jgi:ATP-dependent Clp protease protease subunit